MVEKINQELKIESEVPKKKFLIIGVALLTLGIILVEFSQLFVGGIVLLAAAGSIIVLYLIWMAKHFSSIRDDTKHRKKEEKKQKELRKLLNKFGIDYKNEDEVEALINLLKSQKICNDLWADFGKIAKNITSIAIFPIFTYLLTRIANDAGKIEVLMGAVIIIIGIFTAFLVFICINSILDNILNKTIHSYNKLISDLEKLLVFKNMLLDLSYTEH